MNTVSLFIDGERRAATGGASFTRLNPLDGQVASTAAAASVADAQRAIEAASRAFAAWSAQGPGARRALLMKAAQLLESRSAAFADAMGRETGASARSAHANVHLAAATLLEAAAQTTQVGGELIPSDVPGSLAMGVRQPAGVVLGIAPWNAPVVLAVRAVAVPLACGNTVVLKGSEMCAETHSLVVETLHEAGLPPGVLNYISNAPADAPAVVEAMIAHPAVRRVNFTGSTHVGRIIAQSCARHLKPAILELGGKAPALVLDDADLGAAVAAIAFAAYANSGQVCMSTERIVVDARVADAFVEQLVTKVRGLRSGDPRQGPTVLGSVIGMEAVQRGNRLIRDALAKGARLLCGGEATDTLMPATLLDHVTPEMAIYREESFAPVKAIVRVQGDEQAIAVANDSEFGLAAAVFSRDLARAWNVARRIQSGICHINGPTLHDEPQMPFGGTKQSGYGHFGGSAGVQAFTDLRWITLQTTPRQYPF